MARFHEQDSAISSRRCSVAAHHLRGPVAAPGADHHARVAVELEEAYRGTTRTLDSGAPNETRWLGGITDAHRARHHSGRRHRRRQLIRLAGQGEPPAAPGQAGDLYLEVHIQPHRLFQLEVET